MIFRHLHRGWYHIRKPRQVTENKLALREYRQQLTDARRQVHLDAKEYQDMIENQYLQKHAEETRLQHFNNECEFRKKISQEAFRLSQNLEQWQKEDEKTQNKINKFLHEEDLKRMNRDRIKKILTYESENFWYTSENAEERLTDDVIFPEYIASTEYYHRLHTEALAYENYDFNMLHRVRSNEEAIKQKNKMLIPLFNDLKIQIKEYKTDKEKQINYYHQINVDKIEMLQNISPEKKKQLLDQEKSNFEKKIAQYKDKINDPVKRKNFIREKLRLLLSILGTWKQYTNVLGMTSAQVMKEIQETKSESDVISIRKSVMNQIRSIKNTTFVDAVEEDTEDVEINLADYITQLKAEQIQQTENDAVLDQKEAAENVELTGLLKQAENQLRATKADLTMHKMNPEQKSMSGLVEGLEMPLQSQYSQIPASFLNFNETTASVEAMKEFYKDDQEMQKLLNQIGEVTVDYPKLLKTIWKNTHPIVE